MHGDFIVEHDKIRKFKTEDLDTIMELWLNTNLEAHDFIPERYWQRNEEAVRGMLPGAELFVYEEGNAIQGFVGLSGDYIAGIFVNGDCRSQGIGKALLDHCKAFHSKLSLHVYQKNVGAVRFYRRESFVVSKDQVEKNTGETELVMRWTK